VVSDHGGRAHQDRDSHQQNPHRRDRLEETAAGRGGINRAEQAGRARDCTPPHASRWAGHRQEGPLYGDNTGTRLNNDIGNTGMYQAVVQMYVPDPIIRAVIRYTIIQI